MTSVPSSPLDLPSFTLQHIKISVPKLCFASDFSGSNVEKDVASVSDLETGFSKEVSQDLVQEIPPAHSDSATDSPLALAPPSFPFWSEEETVADAAHLP